MANPLPFWMETLDDGRVLFIDNTTLMIISWFYNPKQVRECFPGKKMIRDAYAKNQ